ncbi:hypothetical protein Heal19_500892 [Lactiplantibacillus plantarum]|uniref:Uncharacterized protein n=1 Tax=Lactiplantibacillus plantarum TaxID=1590 RepID=A0AAW3REV7_LACPN|nr:hypothetical protein NAB2_1579 [Lactiplantibacillus plantarum]QKX09498.1 hypothetical protein Heal19_500892 [Lactiplantibacillus plantarum]
MSLPLNALVGLILSLKPSEPHTLAVLSIGRNAFQLGRYSNG